jgi:hypothetical protein
VTTPSSFTDLKTTSTKSFNENKRPISEISKDEDEDHDNDDNDDDDDEAPEEGNQASLLKTVAEYEAKRATTHPTTTNIQGDTSTGEESEITKFQVTLDRPTDQPASHPRDKVNACTLDSRKTVYVQW